jgi:hypothetical protein
MPKINLPPGLKRCPCCEQNKNAKEDFGIDKRRSDGHNVYCKSCIRTKLRASRRLNPELHKEYSARDRQRNPKRKMLDSAKRRAVNQNVPFNITEGDIDIPKICPICRCVMIRNIGQASGGPCSPTLDKWNPDLGYVSGNVWVICMECNNHKGELSGDELLAFAWKLLESWKGLKNSA